jgi:DNA-binding response OmpR family regulator
LTKPGKGLYSAFPTVALMPILLIVDDDDAIRGMLFDLLSDRYECNTASMAEEALQYIEVEQYDAILTDISMPGLTGVELLQKIQENNSATPVILISGKGSEQDPQALMDLGAFAYVTKPFNLDEIEAVVERAVTKR